MRSFCCLLFGMLALLLLSSCAQRGHSPEASARLQAIEVSWERAAREDTEAGYREYLRLNPVTEYSSQAERRIATLTGPQAAAQWAGLSESNDAQRLKDFVAQYPYSPEARAARRRLANLAAEADWPDVQRQNTADGYRAFIRSHPSAQLAVEARRRLAELDPLAPKPNAATAGVAAWNAGNYGEALRLLQEAVRQGDAGSNFALAIMYWNGQGVPQDFDLAIKHMYAAPGQGGGLAKTMSEASECAKKKSGSPAILVPRGPLTMTNDGHCLRLGLNPTTVK